MIFFLGGGGFSPGGGGGFSPFTVCHISQILRRL